MTKWQHNDSEQVSSPSCCVGWMFSVSSPLMLTVTIWVVELDMPGSRQVTAVETIILLLVSFVGNSFRKSMECLSHTQEIRCS